MEFDNVPYGHSEFISLTVLRVGESPYYFGWIHGLGGHCQIQISDPSISRQHTQFRFANGQWYIQDLQSSTGTYVNNMRVDASRLKQGDQIRVGSSEFEFRVS